MLAVTPGSCTAWAHALSMVRSSQSAGNSFQSIAASGSPCDSPPDQQAAAIASAAAQHPAWVPAWVRFEACCWCRQAFRCPFLLFDRPVRAPVPPAVRRTGLVAGHGIAPWRAEWCMEKDPAPRALAPAKNTKPQQNLRGW